MIDISHKLTTVLEKLPVAVSLVSRTGRLTGTRGGIAGMLGDMIPSRDKQQAERWSFTDDRGVLIPRTEWPSARALRGERDYEGLIGKFSDEGERIVRVISLPLADPTNDIVAITFLNLMETDARGRLRTDPSLEQRLIDELVQAVAAGPPALPGGDALLHRFG